MSLVVDGATSTLTAEAQKLDLVRHFRRALQMFESYKLSRQTSVRSFLDNRNHAAALISENGSIHASNLLFDRLIEADGIDNVFTALTPLNTEGTLSLEEVLRNGNGGAAAIHHADDGARSMLLIEAIDQHGFSENPEDIAYLIKSCHADWNKQANVFLQNTFGLTPTESTIAELLYNGLRSVDIANQRGRTKGTIRKQIKAILQKIGVRDQAELVSTLAGLLHVFDAAPDRKFEGRSLVWSNGAFHKFNLLEVPNKGVLQYHEYGKPDGDPFVFIHGHTSSAEPGAELVRACAKEGLRMIAPCKPGIGRSTITNSETEFRAEDFLDICMALVRHLGLDAPVIAGHGMSGLYAIKAAAAYPGVFSSAALYDTGPPLIHESQFSEMPPKSRQIFWTAKETPELLYAPFAFAAEAFVSSDEGERLFMQTQFEESGHDTEILKQPEIYRSARKAMANFIGTPKRSVDELRMWVSNWSEDLKFALGHLPVVFVHSEYHDWLPAQMVEQYAHRYRRARCQILPGVAQLFLFERPDLFAESARQVLDNGTTV
ncbi:MAG: alpha/beta fold hydrolase [Pseudomonadota bacterium]